MTPRGAGESRAGASTPGGPEGSFSLAAEAAAIFGSRLPDARRYADLLITTGAERGIVGPGEAARIWDRHLLNCAVVACLVPATASVIDVGSGAGLPGIVLAMMLPGARVTLVEPMARRVEFLRECVGELGLDNVDVRRGRAEELAGQLMADVVTARAVAPLDKLAGPAARLARSGGRVLAIKGAAAASELARAQPVLSRLGVRDAQIVQAASASGRITATVVTFTVGRSTGVGSDGDRRPGAPHDEGRFG